MQQFTVPEKIIIGNEVFKDCPDVFSRYGHKALIVTGRHVVKSTMLKRVLSALEKHNLEYVIFSEITSEPTDVMIEAGIKVYKKNNCDFCIGIGGGSPLDSAKAIAAMITNEGSIADYNGQIITKPLPPVVAIPTTAGTGSEATKFTIITDTRNNVKMLLKGDVLLPSLAIVDYSFSESAPRSVTVATGLDALTHAIESFISKRAIPLTDVYAVSAVSRIMKWLPIAVADGKNAMARKEMAIAALEAGICINNSSVTVVHGMSRPIGALFHVPHGISNAMLLTVCLSDMMESAVAKFAALAQAMGCVGTNDKESASNFISSVKHLCNVCEVPSLEKYGINEALFMENLDKMSADAVASGSPANAPKEYTAAMCKALYIQAFK